MFRNIVDWLGQMAVNAAGLLFRWLIVPLGSLIPKRIRDFFSGLGARPTIVSFAIVNHAVCGQANAEAGTFRLSYSVDPAGATITSIEIFRIYTLGAPPFVEPPPPPPLPTNRLPTGEYFESVYRTLAGPVPDGSLSQSVPDIGLRLGAHWGHTVFYRQYRIVVQTPDRSISQSVDVSFGPNPTFDFEGFGQNVRLGRMNLSPNWADIRLHLDNVSEITATKEGEILGISPVPIAYAQSPGGVIDIGAHLCLFSSRGFEPPSAMEEIRFAFLPFDDGAGGCPRAPVPWVTYVGSSDAVLECPPPGD